MSVDFYRSIGMPKANTIHQVDVGSKIVQHYVHSFDEHGNVIVVKGDREDLEKSIGQYQDEVGPKNVYLMIEAGADPMGLLNANKESAFYGDVSNMTAESVNELAAKVGITGQAAEKALEEFNKTYGTSLDMKTFIDLYQSGLLQKHIEGVNNPQKEVEGDHTDGEK